MTPVSRRAVLRGLGSGAAAIITSPVLTAGAAAPSASESGRGSPRLRRYDNENAYGASPRAIDAIRHAASNVHEYGEPMVAELREQIARTHAVNPQRVVVGCGSTDVLRMAVACSLAPGKRFVAARPTCDAVLALAASTGAEMVGVDLTPRHTHDVTGMLAASRRSTGLIYICNPGNPTGTVTSRVELDAFLEKIDPLVTVVMDEAYHHYVDPSPESVSFLERPGGHDGLIVVRSFSKIFGLAGLRVGYAITSPRLASQMTQHTLPLGVSAIAAVAARAALDDREHIQASARRNADDRQEFFNSAGARMVRVIDSQANFAMINTGRSAAGVIEHFAAHGIQLPGVIAKYDNYIRVSIGAAPEMNEFWRVWDLQPGIHSHG